MANKTTLLAAGVFSLAVAALAADKKPDISKLPAPSTKAGISWDADIKPLLDTSCVKCHGAEKPKGKYRVDSKAAFIKGGESDESCDATHGAGS